MRTRVFVLCAALLFSVATLSAKNLPTIDAFAAKRANPGAESVVAERARSLAKIGANLSVEPRLNVPTFLWAGKSGGNPIAGPGGTPINRGGRAEEVAARGHLARYASVYNLAGEDVATAVVEMIHNTGKGPIVVKMSQSIDGVQVFREEINLLMNRNLELIAIGGYISSGSTPAAGPSLQFALDNRAAAIAAFKDLTGTDLTSAQLQPSSMRGGYQFFNVPSLTGLILEEPLRVKKVYFHLPEGFEPGYYVEVAVRNVSTSTVGINSETDVLDYYAYVISATDGRVLFRHNLTVDAAEKLTPAKVTPNVGPSYTYRVWADANGFPYDSPAGNAVHPHIAAVPNGTQPAHQAQVDITVANYPFSQNDPWLDPGATETIGNNVEAFTDAVTPDGYGPVAAPAQPPTGDFRAQATGASAFQHPYDTSINGSATAVQRQAATIQLFLTTNFLHDWFYDSGFDEASRNAQQLNFGRGGVENDRMRAEAQDFSGRNNANMLTPADGARPRMQMYLFDTAAPKYVNVLTPPSAAGIRSVGTGQFGAQVFDMTDDLVQPATAAGCNAGDYAAVSGKIVMVNREPTSGVGSCSIGTKLNHAMAAGASGFILVNLSSTPNTLVNVTGSLPTFTIPFLTITWNGAASIKTAIAALDPVTARMVREAGPERDGTIDNQIVAHEWGHYINNRLVGNGTGLTANQARSMGEGWGDFTALMLTVRADDTLTATNSTWNGAYAVATYSTSGGLDGNLNNGYYFGIRRIPYSTDFTRNALTFRHIQDGEPLPVGPPMLPGANNAQVHNSGEIWASMLWECYASLLRDTQGATPRLTFAEAQSRMKQYMVAGMKMTPVNPTYVEARDAILAAAYATDTVDFVKFWDAFATRGIGVGAVAPDRYSLDHIGVTESFTAAAAVEIASMSLTDAGGSCDGDGFLDAGEGGSLTVTLRNIGNQTLTGISGTISAVSSGITVAGGGSVNFASVDPLDTVSVTVPVSLSHEVAGIQQVDFNMDYSHPALNGGGTISQPLNFRANFDVVPASSATDDVEAPTTTWTISSGTFGAVSPFFRQAVTPLVHQWHYNDPGTGSDERLTSPVMTINGGGSLQIDFDHNWMFEFDGGGNYDGGVIEMSVNGGAYTDIGGASYNGTLLVYGGNVNPLQGRPAYVANSPGSVHTTINQAIAPGSTVQVRFRAASDSALGAPGWNIDTIQFTGIVETPFATLVGDTACTQPTFTALNATPNPASFGAAVTLTATVTSGSTPTGNVNFFDGATNIGTVALSGGQAQLITSSLSIGSHTLTAQYAGAPGFSGSTSPAISQTITKAATSTVVNSVSPNPALQGTSLTFTATVSSSVGTPAGSVTFFDGVTNLGSASLSGGTASLTTSALTNGTHPITATYGGNATYLGSTSPAYNQVVTQPALNFAVNPLRVYEPGGTVTVVVNRTGLLSGTSSVDYTTNTGSADGSDYTPTSGTLNYAASDGSEQFDITIANDGDTEGVHTFTVTLSNAVGATITTATLTIEIIDDEGNFGDIDLDGFADIVWRDTSNGQHALWRMNASGVSSTSSLMTFNDPSWAIVSSGDYNGDGRIDLFWRQASSGTNYIWLMNDTVATAVVQYTVPGSSWSVAGSGDVDADGRSDVIWRNSSTGENYVWYMDNGTIREVAALTAVVDFGWEIVAVGDFNGDLRSDLFWRHIASGINYIWTIGPGSTVTATPVTSVPDTGWKVSAAGDFDGDGDDDLFWKHTGTNANYMWQMNGTTVSAASPMPAFGIGATANVAAAGDFDGDGDDDLMGRIAGGTANEMWLMDGTSNTIVALPAFGSATNNPVSPK